MTRISAGRQNLATTAAWRVFPAAESGRGLYPKFFVLGVRISAGRRRIDILFDLAGQFTFMDVCISSSMMGTSGPSQQEIRHAV